MPDGARGFIRTKWKNASSGHIWNWDQVNGKIRFIETQTGVGVMTEKAVERYMNRASPGSLRMVRIDDLSPLDDVLKVSWEAYWENRRKA